MARFDSTALVLLTFTLLQNVFITSAIDKSNCEPLENLGSPDISRFDYSMKNFDINEDMCTYSLEIEFKHDADLPVPNNPVAQCDPSIVPPEIASDHLPYFAFRWAYESVPEYVKMATGIDHISIDFNPCGHPPLGVFTIPHYDLHIYLVDPEYRSCMTCNKVPGAPICDPDEQTTLSGEGEKLIQKCFYCCFTTILFLFNLSSLITLLHLLKYLICGSPR